MTVKEIVTSEIIKKLEQGIIPWHKPWQGGEAVNYVTQKPYRGINRLLLDGGEYITFKQAIERGGKVKKGAKAKTIVFYKDYEITEIDEDGNEKKKIVPVLRYYKVFSLTDVEGLESKLEITERPNFTIDSCENLIKSYIGCEGINFDPDTVSDRAYYEPFEDKIVVPNIKQHDTAEDYYSTLFHEMVHSTGHPLRLNRFKSDEPAAAFGSETYSREELVAEIGSAFLAEECGISCADTLNNSAGYIQSWIKVLRDDSNAILYAAAKAEKAVELIKSAAAAADVTAAPAPAVSVPASAPVEVETKLTRGKLYLFCRDGNDYCLRKTDGWIDEKKGIGYHKGAHKDTWYATDLKTGLLLYGRYGKRQICVDCVTSSWQDITETRATEKYADRVKTFNNLFAAGKVKTA